MPDAVIHHSVHCTQWLDAASLRAAIAERNPDLSVAVAHTPAELLDSLAEAEVLLTSCDEEVSSTSPADPSSTRRRW